MFTVAQSIRFYEKNDCADALKMGLEFYIVTIFRTCEVVYDGKDENKIQKTAWKHIRLTMLLKYMYMVYKEKYKASFSKVEQREYFSIVNFVHEIKPIQGYNNFDTKYKKRAVLFCYQAVQTQVNLTY